jgi:hypothetical protein
MNRACVQETDLAGSESFAGEKVQKGIFGVIEKDLEYNPIGISSMTSS